MTAPVPSPARRRVLVYINQVYEDDPTGQGAFERDLTAALLRRVEAHPETALHVLTVSRPGGGRGAPASRDPRVERIPLDKRRYASYVAHQWRLGVRLARLLWRLRGDDVALYARHNMAMVAPWLLVLLFRRPLTVRTGPLRRHEEAGRRYGALTYRVAWWLLWAQLRVARALVVVSTVARAWALTEFPFVAGRVVVLPNAVDPSRVGPVPRDRARWGLDERRVVVGCAGTVIEGNGLQTVVRAQARIRCTGGTPPQLLVVGDGPYLNELRRLVTELHGDGDVVFAGRRAATEVPSALAACDVALAPFTAAEIARSGSSALKLFEALACDRPLLAARCLDHAFIEEEQVGRLVDPDDVAAWADALRGLGDAPMTLDGRGRALVERRFGYAHLAERLWAVAFGDLDPGAEISS